MVRSGSSKNPTIIVKEARDFLEQYQQVNGVQSPTASIFASWKPPRDDLLKEVNLRVLWKGMRWKLNEEALSMEIIALHEAERFARLQEIESIVLEGDSIQFLKSIMTIDSDEHAESRDPELQTWIGCGLHSKASEITMVRRNDNRVRFLEVQLYGESVL
ncbi:unnamed protein product [Ilex paraguariensis]|uniref:RNase H type-1 domain-containing protein n=1 Tax=Ilex paraguariensis TaxID=185542 RepID=A0ABC8QZ97_9AQUA